MKIECLTYRPVSKGSFIGFCDLHIIDLGIEIRGCTMYSKDERRWINLPTRAYKNAGGEEKFSQIVRFRDQAQYQEFCADAKEAVDAFISKMRYAQSDGVF